MLRREQFRTARVGEFLDPYHPAVNAFANQGRAFFLQPTGDPAASQQMSWQALENLRQQQAAALAYCSTTSGCLPYWPWHSCSCCRS